MKQKTLLMAMAVAMLTVACNNRPNESTTATEVVDTTATADQPTKFLGTYVGTLPAADVPGIKTKLTLNDDSTYTCTSEPVGQADAAETISGVFHLYDGKLVELVRPSTNEKTYYKLKNDSTLILTDETGKEPEGELAQEYELKLQ